MSSHKKTIFISGGTRGIGRAITLSQASEKTCLLLNYLRDEESALQVKHDAEKKGAEVHLYAGNVGDTENVKSIFELVAKDHPRIDGLIHSAALGVFKPVHQLRAKDWDISMDVNARALLTLTQSALPLMKSHGGKIIAISSLGAGHYTPNYGAIGISKAAMENLVRYLAVELSVFKIQVNAVSGGLVDTESLKMFPDSEKMKKEYLQKTPGGRLGQPEDIASVVSFLLSEQSNWIMGQTLIADGGYSLS